VGRAGQRVDAGARAAELTRRAGHARAVDARAPCGAGRPRTRRSWTRRCASRSAGRHARGRPRPLIAHPVATTSAVSSPSIGRLPPLASRVL
jgi:hypothetical protein